MSSRPIQIYNAATNISETHMRRMVSALDAALPRFCVDWGISAYTVTYAGVPSVGASLPGWSVLVADNTDIAGAQGYHYDSTEGPMGRVFAQTILDNNGNYVLYKDAHSPTVSTVLSHEVFEMIIDPLANLWVSTGSLLVSYEPCDAVQGIIMPGRASDGTLVALNDYVLPAFFDPTPASATGPFDKMNCLTSPFSVASGGYMVTMNGGTVNIVYGASYPVWLMGAKMGALRV